MKKLISLMMFMIMLSFAHAEEAKFSTPILLTSCGQSADVLMVKTLLTKDSLSFDYHPQATALNLEGAGSVILVIGGSSKGLGAAKISAEEESNRVDELMHAAMEKKIPILVAHIGGEARRGDLSDQFNQLGAEHATRLIVVKGGDNDEFFSKIAEAKKIPLESAENILGIEPLLKNLYGK